MTIRRRSLAALSLLVALALVAAACGGGNANDLPGSQWTVTSIGGKTTEAEGTPTIEFGADGKVAGTTGCNRYSGRVEVDGDKITFDSIVSTLIGCDGALGTQEQAFTGALGDTTNWTITASGDLRLTGGGDILAKPIPQQPT
jgi:heat shock protein HslJ